MRAKSTKNKSSVWKSVARGVIHCSTWKQCWWVWCAKRPRPKWKCEEELKCRQKRNSEADYGGKQTNSIKRKNGIQNGDEDKGSAAGCDNVHETTATVRSVSTSRSFLSQLCRVNSAALKRLHHFPFTLTFSCFYRGVTLPLSLSLFLCVFLSQSLAQQRQLCLLLVYHWILTCLKIVNSVEKTNKMKWRLGKFVVDLSGREELRSINSVYFTSISTVSFSRPPFSASRKSFQMQNVECWWLPLFIDSTNGEYFPGVDKIQI